MDYPVLDFTRSATSQIHVEPEALDRLDAFLDQEGATRFALIADSQVAKLYGKKIRKQLERLRPVSAVLTLPRGETSKSYRWVETLHEELMRSGMDRGAMIVALGGGVTLDTAGFVAATYLRGVRWTSLPTSLLAQVDAGIGGKTGINTSQGKNMVGAFHPPLQVIVDPVVLGTLPRIEWLNGLAEVVKHGWIADEPLFTLLEEQAPNLASGSNLDVVDWIVQAVNVKCAVVAEDPFEQGKRAILNAGHTVGHAIEAASGHAIRHGFAVAMGLLVEALAARSIVDLPDLDIERLESLLRTLNLLPDVTGLWFDDLLPYMLRDKKNREGRIRISVPNRLGSFAGDAWTCDLPASRIQATWKDLA